jgi:protein TonB
MFKDLPATFPDKDKYRKPSVASSLIFHGLLILGLVVIPLLLPQALPKRELFITMVAPLPPPPALPRPPAVQPVATQHKTDSVIRPVVTEALVAPTVVPKVVVPIIDPPAAPVVGGVPGGLPGGAMGGVLGGVLSGNCAVAPPSFAPPPSPPPPPPVASVTPTGPVRVGLLCIRHLRHGRM